MGVQCIYYRPGKDQFCHALKALGEQRFSLATRLRLNHTYCSHGRFILCPIYKYVERALAECDRRREVASKEQPADAAAR
jgi:hypothetical protein